MEKGNLRDKPLVLAIRQTDIKYRYRKQFLESIEITANKVIELRENQLLEPLKLQKYTALSIIHDKKILRVPILQGSFRYAGGQNSVLKCYLPASVRVKEEDLHNWHLRLLNKSKREGD